MTLYNEHRPGYKDRTRIPGPIEPMDAHAHISPRYVIALIAAVAVIAWGLV